MVRLRPDVIVAAGGHVTALVTHDLTKEIPIVFITGHGDETVRPRMLAEGAAECLLKPFSDASLREALDVALRGAE